MGGSLHSPSHFAASLPDDQPIVLVFGAMATGAISMAEHPYVRQLNDYYCNGSGSGITNAFSI